MGYMIIPATILLPILILTVKSIITKKDISTIERKIMAILIIYNLMYIILFTSDFATFIVNLQEKMVTFWINLALNIILFVLLLNKKIVIKRKPMTFIMIIFLLCMIFMPTYSFEGHTHLYDTENSITIGNVTIPNDTTKKYTAYYNWYGMQLMTIYK